MRLVALVAGGMMMYVAVNYILHEHSVVINTPVNPMFSTVLQSPNSEPVHSTGALQVTARVATAPKVEPLLTG